MTGKGKPFVHLELCTPDVTKAKEFYSKMFGWEFADNEMDSMGMCSTIQPADGLGGGLYSLPEGHVFEWEFAEGDMESLQICSTFQQDGAADCGYCSTPEAHATWSAYIGVDDIKAATKQARSLGAEISVDSREIPHFGWMTVLKDPTGCLISMFQPLPSTGETR
jgi:predicted enzyme related to lactoylglutathione lyase